jgi:dTDP-4-amino-4,6-dideoxygalactose transaminase
LDNLQAAVLNLKFKRIIDTLSTRKRIAKQYDDGLAGLSLTLPPKVDGRTYQDYIVRTDRRDELHTFLKECGVETLKNEYPFPVPKLPLAAAYEAETLRLPCNEVVSDEEVKYVISSIKKFYESTFNG